MIYSKKALPKFGSALLQYAFFTNEILNPIFAANV
jgi:hypothetical protein